MAEPLPEFNPEPFTYFAEDRAFMDRIAQEIARFLYTKRLWKTDWSAETEGCRFRITVKGYAKTGSQRWQEEEAERQAADHALEEEA